MNARRTNLWFSAGSTLILAGYLMVWLPHDAAGLSFIGIEIGEWVKFLPAVQTGQITPGRDLFYLPPITLGLILGLYTSGWPNRKVQTWVIRGLAVLVSLLAFPSLDAIRFEPRSEWLLRLVMIGLVMVVTLSSSITGRWDRRVIWVLISLLAFLGFALPTWAFWAVRPEIVALWQQPVRPGSGVWLNAIGHLLLFFLGMRHLRRAHPAG